MWPSGSSEALRPRSAVSSSLPITGGKWNTRNATKKKKKKLAAIDRYYKKDLSTCDTSYCSALEGMGVGGVVNGDDENKREALTKREDKKVAQEGGRRKEILVITVFIFELCENGG